MLGELMTLFAVSLTSSLEQMVGTLCTTRLWDAVLNISK